MKKRTFMFPILVCVTISLFAQSADPVILSYQRNFIRASMSTKQELLNDASRITTMNMVQLYIDALVFVRQNYPYLGNDAQLMDLAITAASKSSAYQDTSIIPVLKDIFSAISEPKVKIACLDNFAVLAKGRRDDISFLNGWFEQSLQGLNGNSTNDVRTIAICASTLGTLGDSSSFPVLFTAATGNYDSSIIDAASSALNMLNDGYTDNILAILSQKNIKNMYAAYTYAMKKDSLPITDQGKIAEAAFTAAVELKTAGAVDNQVMLQSLIHDTLEKLTALSWSQAAPSVIKYFYQIQGDYKNDKSGVDALLPVIRCMGTMGTTDSAQALSIFLGLLNSETEQKKIYNEQLMLTLIQALGDLGDKTAFDYLLYVGYLSYPETVKKASRDALARLAW